MRSLSVTLLLTLATTAAARGPDCDRLTRQLATLEQTRGDEHPGVQRLRRRVATRCVRLNHIQVLGSHNSYHIQPRPELLSLLVAFSPELSSLEYTHVPLPQQFDEQGIRQIELDVFADPGGGLYAQRRGLILLNQDPMGPPVLQEPGLKVLHVQDVDFETTCLTFVECLQTIRRWSRTHPGHLPFMVLIEAKDDPIPDPVNLGFTVPLPFGAAELDTIDTEIRSVFRRRELITPDDVRGKLASLDEAVRTRGWPTLAAARGRVMFCLDNGGERRDLYLQGHPAGAGRVLFTDAPPGSPEAGFVKMNDSLETETIAALVAAGYVVRTRADADTVEARTGDTTRREAALASGAQWVSSDYPVPNPAFGTGYHASIPDGAPARCNPVNAPPGCHPSALELLRRR